MGRALGFGAKAPAVSQPAGPSAEELAAAERQRLDAERTRADEERRAQVERDAFANRLRGRAAFLSSAGETGYRLGGV